MIFKTEMSLELKAMACVEIAVAGANAAQVAQASGEIRIGAAWQNVGEMTDFIQPTQTAGGQYIDPVSRACVAAARLLKEHLPATSPERTGCILRTHTSNAYSIASYESARLSGKRPRPLLFAHAGWNVPLALTAREMNISGFAVTLIDIGQDGSGILRYASDVMRLGRAEEMLVGCAELVSIEATNSAGQLVRSGCVMCVLSGATCSAASEISEDDFLEKSQCLRP